MRISFNIFQPSLSVARCRSGGYVPRVSTLPPSFDLHGPAIPASPIVVSVPHAGRDYPLILRAALRVPLAALLPLEDRLVDTLALAARTDETMIVARRPRAWIDLNRAEHERDPRLDDGASMMGMPFASAKVRSGLGLIPRRVAGAGDLWSRRFGADEVTARIAADHRPYHRAIADALSAARMRFGVAVLVDLHSMPTITGDGAASIVIGDRFGRASSAHFVGRLEDVARHHGIASALNTPYAGGHILEHHARPAHGIHAIQLEIDRALYLDATSEQAGEGFAATVRLLRDMLAALADAALPVAVAAE